MKAINRTLQQMKINSGEMHSDLEQAERDEILYKFKTGQIDVLVATDIVARGIDIDDIAMVINFDVPHDPEDYVHRIGRTARAERDGVAITFVSDDEIYSFKQIEKFLDRDVEKVALPEGLGETPDYNAPRGKGKSDRNNRGRGRGKKPTTDKQATDSEKKPRNNRRRKPQNADNNVEQPANTTTGNAEQTTVDNTQQPDNSTTVNVQTDGEKKPRNKRNRKPRRRQENGETTGEQNNSNEQKTDKEQKPRNEKKTRGEQKLVASRSQTTNISQITTESQTTVSVRTLNRSLKASRSHVDNNSAATAASLILQNQHLHQTCQQSSKQVLSQRF